MQSYVRRPSSVCPSVRPSVNFYANRFFYQTNDWIATKLTQRGPHMGLHPSSSLIVWVNLHSNFRGGLRKTHVFWMTVRNGPSRSSKVVDFGTNQKRVCDFLLVINSNLGPFLPRFRDIAGFLRRILGVFALDYRLALLCWLRGAKTLSQLFV